MRTSNNTSRRGCSGVVEGVGVVCCGVGGGGCGGGGGRSAGDGGGVGLILV